MDQKLLDESAFEMFSAPLRAEGYEAEDIAIMWAGKKAFRDEIALAYANAAITAARIAVLMRVGCSLPATTAALEPRQKPSHRR